jgi:hypothetical protein
MSLYRKRTAKVSNRFSRLASKILVKLTSVKPLKPIIIVITCKDDIRPVVFSQSSLFIYICTFNPTVHQVGKILNPALKCTALSLYRCQSYICSPTRMFWSWPSRLSLYYPAYFLICACWCILDSQTLAPSKCFGGKLFAYMNEACRNSKKYLGCLSLYYFLGQARK